MKDGDRFDPASIRLRIGGREYKIGTRVWTPEGSATVTGFDPTTEDGNDIGVTLDGTTEEIYTTWEYAEPIDYEPIVSNDAEDRERLQFA